MPPWPLVLLLGVLLGLALPMLLAMMLDWHQNASLQGTGRHGSVLHGSTVPVMSMPPPSPLLPCPSPFPPDVEEGGGAPLKRPYLGNTGSFMQKVEEGGEDRWQCIRCLMLFPGLGRAGAKQHDEAISLRGLTCEQASAEARGEPC